MLRDITVGRYIPGTSPLHRADARTKILCTVMYSISVIAAKTIPQMACVFIFTAIAVYISKIRIKYMLKGLKPLRWFMLFTFIMNLFVSGGTILVSLGSLCITTAGIYKAVIITLRFIFFVAGTSLLTLTTPPIALTDALALLMKPLKLLHVPVDDIAMIISITLRFIPTFADEAERIMKAQRARGADFGSGSFISRIKAVIPVTIPLFLSVFRHADELSMAMDVRCYGKGIRIPRKVSKFTSIDAKTAIATIIFCVFLLFMKFMIEF